MQYPLAEGFEFKWRCPGCGNGKKSTIPRHNAPFVSRCREEGCGWSMTVQTDPAGISAGFTAPIPKKPELRLIKGEA